MWTEEQRRARRAARLDRDIKAMREKDERRRVLRRQREEAEQVRQYRKNLESVARHQPRVTRVENNGKYLTVEFVRNNGDVVSAHYTLSGWGQPPSEVLAEVWEGMRKAATMGKNGPPIKVAWGAQTPKARERKRKPRKLKP